MELFQRNICLFIVCSFLIQEFQAHRSECPFATQFNRHRTLRVRHDPDSHNCGGHSSPCHESKYRSYDGSCNNLENPGWGMPNTAYERLLPPRYSDGISLPPSAKSGQQLPSAREVSFTVFPDVPIKDKIWTLAVMEYGQMLSHDMSALARKPHKKHSAARCCSADGKLLNLAYCVKYCFPILVPSNDPVFAKHNIQCMDFDRTVTDRDEHCVDGHRPAEQLSSVNHFLDLSDVYGNDNETNAKLRKFEGGLLKADHEPRGKHTPSINIILTIYLKEHSRIAKKLAKLNPHWDDEKIFQEARKINIAQHQRIVYYEMLPILIGHENAYDKKILVNTNHYVNDYDPKINPTVLNEHSAAAYRYFHTLIPGEFQLVDENRNITGSIRLSDFYNQPDVESGNNFVYFTRGISTQPQMAADPYYDSEIGLKWNREPGKPLGVDLEAISIQRNRDHALASYNDYRVKCGLPRAERFKDFSDVISEENVDKLASIYESPDDVDLIVGGTLENLVKGTLAGPTFLCILSEQFYKSRVGDRYWFENEGEQGFTLPQLNQIRKASLSRLLCDNEPEIRHMQPRGFEQISESNKLEPCKLLPEVDLDLWKDYTIS